jgi:electron transfer flavoprotein beta subunit
MNIAVCIKYILDPELPPSVFEIDPDRREAKKEGKPQFMDPYSSNALEMAIQLKEKQPDANVIAITIGEEKAEDCLRKAFGVLANEAIHITIDENLFLDSYATAKLLAAAIKKRGDIDIVMCGRQAGDWDAGIVGSLLAEELDLPSVCFISKAEMTESGVRVSRNVETGTEILTIEPPVLLTVTNDESNVMRIAKVKDVMKAHRKPIEKLDITALGIDPTTVSAPKAYQELSALYIPVQDKVCEILEGEEPEEKVSALLKKLRENKFL